MDKKYVCYCGLYCENCSFMARVAPAMKDLHTLIKAEGFDFVLQFLDKGDEFWEFLTCIAENGICISCKEGGGNPACEIRICAREKGLDVCAFCPEYPCKKFEQMSGHPLLKADNDLLRDNGWDEWAKLQDDRKERHITYSDIKREYK